MAFGIDISVRDGITSRVRRLIDRLEDPTELHESIASKAGEATGDYIAHVAAPTRHKTATRLGAEPTGYLSRAADSIQAKGTRERAVVTISGDVAIFARVDGPVTIAPKAPKKYLTIPAIAEAYGKRAGEFPNLKVLIFRKRASAELLLALGEEIGEGANKERTVFYWLKKSVTLPQDRELLPSDDDYRQIVKEAADFWYKNTVNPPGGSN